MKQDFERSLLESGQWLKRGAASLLNNVGKTVAIITALIACLVTFTDVTFSRLDLEHISATLLLLLFASYVIFFSLEDAGERLGEESEEYRHATAALQAAQQRVTGEQLVALRDFLSQYTESELTHRRRALLLSYGITEEEYAAYCRGVRMPRRLRHRLRRVRRLSPIVLTPRTLLSRERQHGGSELCDPERGKYPRLLLRLIPSTLSVLLTVSVMLSGKEGMGVADVIDGILKLSTLPMIGLKGYVAGYTYSRHTLPVWTETKTRLLTAFLHRENTPAAQSEAKEVKITQTP